MMGLACLRAMELAGRARIDLNEAERLRLEQHLERCPRCAEDVTLLDAAAERLRGAPIDATSHARAFARAWSKRDVKHGGSGARAPWATGRALAAISAVVAAAAALVLVFGSGKGAPEPSLPSSSVAAPIEEPALAGTLALEPGEELEVPGATLAAIESSTFEIDAQATTVRIVRGAMRFEVEPGREAPFRVESDAVRVEVLGTVFEVQGAEVRVERGRVRASTPTGAIAVVLGAGEEWSASLPERTTAGPAPEATPTASASVSVASADPLAILARARRHLAAGEVTQAKALVQRALSMGLAPALDAEARTLLAECALVSGNSAEAARRYAEVARKHGDSPAGETALFAAARAAHSSGQSGEAKRLFQEYLRRHPNGQFVKEAQRRLAQLAQADGGRK